MDTSIPDIIVLLWDLIANVSPQFDALKSFMFKQLIHKNLNSFISVFFSSIFRFPLSQKILGVHEEVEELLESHLMDCNSLGEQLAYLMVTMQNAEDLVSTDCI
jgi:hypothetical protein